MSKKKKIIVLSSMIALLAITAVFNFILTTSKSQSDTSVTASANYFSEYRTNRLTTRNEELLQLDSIIASAEETSTEKSNALNLKIQLTEITEQELLLESLIKAQGFEDVVVTIGLNSENVNVIVKSADLTLDDAIKIYSIIEDEAIATSENVKIIPIS